MRAFLPSALLLLLLTVPIFGRRGAGAVEEVLAQTDAVQFSSFNGSASVDRTHNINKIVDVLLALARVEVQSRGLNKIKLPDFEETFHKKIAHIKVKGTLKAYNGWAKSMTSLQRKGDATASGSDLKFTIEVPIGFGDLQFRYRYKTHLAKKKVGGHADATVGSNAVRLRASVAVTADSCSAAVDSLQLTDLGKIKVKATGLGPFNFLLDKMADWMLKRMHSKLENTIQNDLRDVIDKAGLHFKCPF